MHKYKTEQLQGNYSVQATSVYRDFTIGVFCLSSMIQGHVPCKNLIDSVSPNTLISFIGIPLIPPAAIV